MRKKLTTFGKDVILKTGKLTGGNSVLTIILYSLIPQIFVYPLKFRSALYIKQLSQKFELARSKGREGIRVFQFSPRLSTWLITLISVITSYVVSQSIKQTKEDAAFNSKGFLWIKDLSKPDHRFILPVFLVLLRWLKLQFGSLNFDGETTSFARPLMSDPKTVIQTSQRTTNLIYIAELLLKYSPFISLIWYRKRATSQVLYELTSEICDITGNVVINLTINSKK
jgi:hypothetical protein